MLPGFVMVRKSGLSKCFRQESNSLIAQIPFIIKVICRLTDHRRGTIGLEWQSLEGVMSKQGEEVLPYLSLNGFEEMREAMMDQ